MDLQSVDQIVHADWVLPVEPQDTVLAQHAVVLDQGRIRDVLPSAELSQRYCSERETRLPGQVLIPGLVNTHCHAAMSLLRGLADDHELMDWLQKHIWPAEARCVGEDFVRTGTRLAIAEMLGSGTTCFSDMYFFPDVVAATVIETGIRAQIAFPILEQASPWAASVDEYLAKGLQVRDRFKDSERLSFAFGPHAPYTNSDQSLARIAMLAAELDAPVHIHLHETAGEISDSIARHGQRPLARLQRLGLVSPRLQAVHMTQVDDSDMALLATHGAQVLHCPSSNLKLGAGFCPVGRLLGAGVNVALGSDGAASNNSLDLFAETRLAALLCKGLGQDPTALGAHAALRLATLQGAQALGLGERIGSLVPGKEADLVAVDLRRVASSPVYDPCSALIYTASGAAVSHVWVRGRMLLQDGQLLELDSVELLRQADHWRERIARGDHD